VGGLMALWDEWHTRALADDEDEEETEEAEFDD